MKKFFQSAAIGAVLLAGAWAILPGSNVKKESADNPLTDKVKTTHVSYHSNAKMNNRVVSFNSHGTAYGEHGISRGDVDLDGLAEVQCTDLEKTRNQRRQAIVNAIVATNPNRNGEIELTPGFDDESLRKKCGGGSAPALTQ